MIDEQSASLCPHLANNHRVRTRIRCLAAVQSAVAWLRSGKR